MAKPPRGSKTPGEMCSYDPKTGLYTDRWLWEEISGEDLSAPFPPPSTEPLVDVWDPAEPLRDPEDDPYHEPG